MQISKFPFILSGRQRSRKTANYNPTGLIRFLFFACCEMFNIFMGLTLFTSHDLKTGALYKVFAYKTTSQDGRRSETFVLWYCRTIVKWMLVLFFDQEYMNLNFEKLKRVTKPLASYWHELNMLIDYQWGPVNVTLYKWIRMSGYRDQCSRNGRKVRMSGYRDQCSRNGRRVRMSGYIDQCSRNGA